MDCRECVKVSLADKRLKTNVPLCGHLLNSRIWLLCTADGMGEGVQVSSTGKLPFGPKGVDDTTSCLSLSSDWGVGTWLVCVNPKSLHPQDFQAQRIHF